MPPKHTTVIEVKIRVSRLKLGMFVYRLDKAWGESSFVFQGFLITSDFLIKKLQEECDYVYIDENRGLPAEKPLAEIASKKEQKPQKSFLDKLLRRKNNSYIRKHTHKLNDIVNHIVATDSITPPAKSVSFDQEQKAAELAYTEASNLIKDFLSSVKQGGVIDIIAAKHIVYDCMSSILRSPDAMLLLIRLKNKDYSVWQHSMNVCVFAISLGRYLNLHDDELILLGLCGMFHDIGKLRISNDVLEAAHSKKELKEVLDFHTLLGRDVLLKSMGQLAEVAAQVAYCHHEHLDGSGFPRGLQGGQISAYTRMISIVNVYDNLTTNKPGKKALSHYDAMTVLLEKSGQYFDGTLVNSFNRCIGTYPVGCVVEMNSGEIAMVVEDNQTYRLRPKIMLLTNPDKAKSPKKMVNLAALEFTSEADSYFIKALIDPEAYGIKL